MEKALPLRESVIAAALQEAWADVLGRPPSSEHDNFFGCGGTSLAAFRLLRRIEERFGASALLASEMFDGPTFAQMVENITASQLAPNRSENG